MKRSHVERIRREARIQRGYPTYGDLGEDEYQLVAKRLGITLDPSPWYANNVSLRNYDFYARFSEQAQAGILDCPLWTKLSRSMVAGSKMPVGTHKNFLRGTVGGRHEQPG